MGKFYEQELPELTHTNIDMVDDEQVANGTEDAQAKSKSRRR